MARVLLALAGVLVTAVPAQAQPAIESVRAVLRGDGAAAVVVRAREMSGVRVDRADGAGAFGQSACRVGAAPPSGTATVPVPAGDGEITVTVTSSGCDGRQMPAPTASESFDLVLPVVGEIELPELIPLPKLPIAIASSACADADLEVRGATRKRVRAAIACLVNRERARRGLRPLLVSGRLERAAAAHTRDMRARQYFDHVRPGGPDLLERLDAADYRAATAGENLAAATGELATARLTVGAWLHSPEHRANLFYSDFRVLGVGLEPLFPDPPTWPGLTVATIFARHLGPFR